MPNSDLSLRRPPKQERSRERVEEILGAAKRLIGEKGVDAVKMREIAALAGGPISSVYQYFPNKSAIIATLHGHWSAQVYEVVELALAEVDGLDAISDAADMILDTFHDRVRSDPAIVDLMNAVRADKTLKEADIAETRRQAKLFCDKARPWIEDSQSDAFDCLTFLMFELANGAVRLALALDGPESPAILAGYKAIIRTQLRQFARQT